MYYIRYNHLSTLPMGSTDCLAASLKQSPLPLKTIGQACRDQAHKLLEALILFAYEKLQQGGTAASVLDTLFAKQRLVAT